MDAKSREIQTTMDFDRAERQSVLELWTVDEIFEQATGELLVRLYEDTRIERKPSGFHAESMATYICMWANTGPSGGLIAFGIHDKGEILGCSDKGKELIKNETQARNDLVRDARVETKRVQVQTASGKADFIYLMRVHFRDDKVVETNKGEAYVRRGHTRHLLTKEERHELEIERGQVNFELEPCNLQWPDDFDMAAIESWVGDVYKMKNMRREHEQNQQVLLRHRLGKIRRGEFAPNNACALLFAKDPQAVVPGCMLRFQRFEGTRRGTGKERNVIKNIEIAGTIPNIIINASILIGSQLREYARYGKDGKFFPVPEYPQEAWQEAIVNACVHRSYSLRGANIFVRMFDDRLEVESPGGFPALVNPRNIYETHFRRNWWIMDAMAYMKYVLCENEGANRMRNAMLEMGLPEPMFEQKESEGDLTKSWS